MTPSASSFYYFYAVMVDDVLSSLHKEWQPAVDAAKEVVQKYNVRASIYKMSEAALFKPTFGKEKA